MTDATTDYRISYPEDLPVSQRREDIAAAIRDHQVVIIAGETGSGKTTPSRGASLRARSPSASPRSSALPWAGSSGTR
jgi:tRNA A37 threonylcarbamoyladenosine biosynthesis protein TsaE